jgi:2-C-methyl-D-erythritol 4-phosphate cytidylyltransferase
MAHTTAIVVAAGAGERFGGGLPKAFVELASRPLMLYSVRTLHDCAGVGAVVLVVGAEHERQARRLLRDHGLGDVEVCAGGDTRPASVSAGLARCARDTRVVAVHDAARPLVTRAVIERVLAALIPPWDAVAPGVPVVDTLKLVDEARAVLRTVDRRGLWIAQTPQVFSRGTLARVHARLPGPDGSPTDDLSLVERAGGRIRMVDGDPRNLKVTFAADARIAEALIVAGGPDAAAEGRR